MGKPHHIGTVHANVRRIAGQHALNLSAIAETDIAAPLPVAFDLDALAECLRLDSDEAAWFSAILLDGLTSTEALDRLGWGRLRIDRVRKRVTRKLARYRRRTAREAFDPDSFVIRGSSLQMCYLERLPSGRSCYAMVRVDEGFESIMAAERNPRKAKSRAKTIAA